jgi:hypothetical protein
MNNVFSQLSEHCLQLNNRIVQDENDLKLYDKVSEINSSPYYSEADKHLKIDLPQSIIRPEPLMSQIQSFNDDVDQFINVTIPTKVRESLKNICKLIENPYDSHDNTIIIPYVISYLKKYWFSNGSINLPLYFENGILWVEHTLGLAQITPELENRLRQKIEILKRDYSIASILNGNIGTGGLRHRKQELINNGIELGEYIRDKILFEIERGTYSTICDDCPK